MAFSFGKKFRLAGRGVFRKILSKANLRQELCGVSLYSCANNLGYSRLGVLVPKKNVPQAVQRNHWRRIAREQFRLSREQLGSLDIVLVVRNSSRDNGLLVMRGMLDKLIHEENFIVVN